jgi:hypothetical protein
MFSPERSLSELNRWNSESASPPRAASQTIAKTPLVTAAAKGQAGKSLTTGRSVRIAHHECQVGRCRPAAEAKHERDRSSGRRPVLRREPQGTDPS